MELTTSTTSQINITKIITLCPVRQESHTQFVHVICHGLRCTAIRSGLISIKPIPFSVVDEFGIVSENIGVELELDSVWIGNRERLDSIAICIE